jgi:predicted Ser/Thr protein kinase
MRGTILGGRYRLAEEIGMGGMGVVYRAADLRTGGQVAVKIPHTALTRDPIYRERLRREAHLAAALTSPRVVRIIDLDDDAGVSFLVMEYVAGETLHDHLARQGRLAAPAALGIALEVARALEAAHELGIVHRDLKPQNIKLVDGQVKVLDFGIARTEGIPGLTGTGGFVGTPEYCAPERADGQGDVRADIYALGVMLFQMLEGRLPFQGATALATLRLHETAALPPLSDDVPAAARAVVARCLAKSEADRYQTPAELVAALGGGGVPAAPMATTRDLPLAVHSETPVERTETPWTAVALASAGWLVGGAIEPSFLRATVDLVEFDPASMVGRIVGGALAGLITALVLNPVQLRVRLTGVAVVGAAAGAFVGSPMLGRSPGESLGMALGGFVAAALVVLVGFRWREPANRWLQILVVVLAAAIGGSVVGAALEPIKQMVDARVDEIGAQVFSGTLGVGVGAFVATLAALWAAPRVAWDRVVVLTALATVAWAIGGALGANLGFPLWVAVGGGLVAWQMVRRAGLSASGQ